MAEKRITGTVTHLDLEGGFWGIIDEQGNKWQPVNFPNQLKHDGVKVELKIKLMEDQVSIQMWGTPVFILSFHTLSPS